MDVDVDVGAGGAGSVSVTVSCSLSPPPEPLGDAPDTPVTVRLSIQDVTMADEASVVVAELAVEAASLRELGGPYELKATVTPGRQYAVFAHVERAGQNTVTPGDLINTQMVPLPPASPGGEVSVDVPVHVV